MAAFARTLFVRIRPLHTGYGNAFSLITGGNLYVTVRKPLQNSAIGAKAFAGTKSLTKLKISYLPIAKYTYKKNGRLKSIKLSKGDYVSISKKAFSKCGKKKGKKLMLVFGTNGVYKDDAKVYKKLFKSKGLPRGAQLKTYQ